MIAEYYLWIKSLHILAVIAWMAGMMYLPRLFVYHCDAPVGSQQSETFKIMERRLLRGIINPALLLMLAFGGALLLVPGLVNWTQGWMWAKLTLVIGMLGLHGFLSRITREFAVDLRKRPAGFYRLINEAPFVLLIGIVILVVVRPF